MLRSKAAAAAGCPLGLLFGRALSSSRWLPKGDMSELAMHQQAARVSDPENDPGMPGMEDPVLGSFDTPTDLAVEDPDEDEGGSSRVGGEATYPPEMLAAVQAELDREEARGGGQTGWRGGGEGDGDNPSPELRAAARQLDEALKQKGRSSGYMRHAHHLADLDSVKQEPHPTDADLRDPAEPKDGVLPVDEITLPGESLRQAMATNLPQLRQAARSRPDCDKGHTGHEVTGPAAGYSGGD